MQWLRYCILSYLDLKREELKLGDVSDFLNPWQCELAAWMYMWLFWWSSLLKQGLTTLTFCPMIVAFFRICFTNWKSESTTCRSNQEMSWQLEISLIFFKILSIVPGSNMNLSFDIDHPVSIRMFYQLHSAIA